MKNLILLQAISSKQA